MAQYYFICGLDPEYSDREKIMADELYDKFSHNEISGPEIISKIVTYTAESGKTLDGGPDDYAENGQTGKNVFEDGRYKLCYDSFCGAWDVYMRMDL